MAFIDLDPWAQAPSGLGAINAIHPSRPWYNYYIYISVVRHFVRVHVHVYTCLLFQRSANLTVHAHTLQREIESYGKNTKWQKYSENVLCRVSLALPTLLIQWHREYCSTFGRSRPHPPTYCMHTREHAYSCSCHLNWWPFSSPYSNAVRTPTQGTAAVASKAKLWGN